MTSTVSHAQNRLALSELASSDALVILGDRAGARVGFSISGGDLNGDGLADLVLGSPGTQLPGKAFVVQGSSARFAAPELDLSNPDERIYSATQDSPEIGAGFAVASGCDINGDGLDDLIVGDPYAGPDPGLGPDAAGIAYIIFGVSTSPQTPVQFSALDGTTGFSVTGETPDAALGRSVACLGDINNDAIEDFALGGSFANQFTGEFHVIFGQPSFAATLDLSTIDGTNGFTLNGQSAGDVLGSSISSAGDFNGDGLADLVVTAPFAQRDPQNGEGEAYVILGRNSAFPASVSLPPSEPGTGFSVLSTTLSRQIWVTGRAVDINGDGFDDLLLSTPNFEGYGYVIFGTDASVTGPIDVAMLNGTTGFALVGEQFTDSAGFDIAGAGDVNGDGFDDLLISAPDTDPNGVAEAGTVYAVFGKQEPFSPTVALSGLSGPDGLAIIGIDEDDRMGTSIVGAGDFNGDGIDDVALGSARGDPLGRDNAGDVYVVYGNAVPRATRSDLILGRQNENELDAAGFEVSLAQQVYADVQPFAGIGIIANPNNALQGQWQYSGSGQTWQAVPTDVNDASAAVLVPTDRLRFLPVAGYSGQPDPLVVRLWDGRWTTSGQSRDITSAIGAFGGFADNNNLLAISITVQELLFKDSFEQ